MGAASESLCSWGLGLSLSVKATNPILLEKGSSVPLRVCILSTFVLLYCLENSQYDPPVLQPSPRRSPAYAYTTFETTCSVPNTTTNFVSSPDTRGTLDILWSCLFTILACTWTVQHLNLPEQRGDKDQGWRGDIKWKLKGFWISMKWMLVTAIAPEVLIMENIGGLDITRKCLPKLLQLAAEDQVSWTLTHTLFANMGGFMIRGRERGQKGGIDQGYSTFAYLHSFHLIKLRETGHLRSLPNESLEDIEDKSKSDIFARLTAIAQITWTVFQGIVRAAKGLAISQLEIAVIAFSSCAIIIYALNWKKPKGVKVPYFVLTYEEGIPQDLREIMEKTSKDFQSPTLGYSKFWWESAAIAPFDSPIRNGDSKNHPDFKDEFSASGWVILLGTIVFGRIHIAAWNLDFPTHAEQLVWRIASLWCTVALIAMMVLFSFFLCAGETVGRLAVKIITPLSIVVYVLARLFLLVETFRALCYLPPAAYISTWATNLPHLA